MSILDLIFPRQCLDCGKTGDYFCKECKKKLQPHMEICPSCHKYSTDYETCLDCRSNKSFVLDGILVPFSYSGPLKKIVLRLKYYHKKDVIDFAIDRVVLAIYANRILYNKMETPQKSGQEGRVIVSGIPSHRYRRYFVKGYNQSYLLAKDLAKKLNIPYKNFMKKNKRTKSQASLDRVGRLKNLENAFEFKGDISFLDNTDTVILVDDITTTGSTMNEVAKLIKNYFPRISVRGVVLGRKDR